ncbi:MAG: hypothetical protein QM523_01015 [Candidatus Pacebacteria bacterium]|nr:hypothetical protein [Candidatus Paceibacterota bacterium]
MDCYVADGYWDIGYTESDICGIMPPAPLDPIYSAAWMPIIRLDRKGQPVSLEKLRKRVVKAVPEEKREEVRAAFERIETPPPNLPDPAVWDGIALELQSIADSLPTLQRGLIAEIQALAYDMALIAEDEREIEMLLLSM